MKHDVAVQILVALGQPHRLSIYKLLLDNHDGLSAGDIARFLNVPSATLSFHLHILSIAKLVSSDKRGRTITYSAKKKIINKLNDYITSSLLNNMTEKPD